MSKIKKGKNVIFHGKVEIGVGTTIQDNVILGNLEEGTLKIGESSIIRSGTIIYSNVEIGKKFETGHNVLIRENVTIGDGVLVGTNSTVDGECKIGKEVKIQTGVYIPKKTIIEEGVFLGPFAVLANDKYMKYGSEIEGPIIKRRAKIGANATILAGVVVGKNATVGAGAVVTKDVAPEDVVVGSPARNIEEV